MKDSENVQSAQAAPKKKRHGCLKAFIILVALIGLGIFVFYGYLNWWGVVPEADYEARKPYSENIDTSLYQPYESINIARLNEPATLKFDDNYPLPRLDEASALLPFVSAVVTAVYPEEKTMCSWRDSDIDRMIEIIEESEDNMTGEKYAELRQEMWVSGFAIYYNNSSWGFQELVDGTTDVFFGTMPSQEQLDYAAEHGVEFEYTPIGQEAFVFIVNGANPVDSLTTEQVKDIYSGKITNWKKVGGNRAEIIAYQRNQNSGSQSRMQRFMGDTPLMDAPKSRVIDVMSGLIESVAAYANGENAIGYSFRYYVVGIIGSENVKMLAIDGVEPTAENIANGSYPLSSNFVAVTRKGESNPNVQALLDWLRGPQGQELVEGSGYVKLG